MSTPPPLVSVVIPAWRAAATIVETLESVFAQDHENFEIVVVDDGSPDDLLDVLAPYRSRIRLHSQQNAGLARARNVGIELARGEYVALLDNDDLCTPDRLSTQVRLLTVRPDLMLCSSEFSTFDASGPLAPTFSSEYYSRIGETPQGLDSLLPERFQLTADTSVHIGEAYEALVFGNFVHPPTVMFRRELFARVGPFDETLRVNTDWEWIVRASRPAPIGIIDRPLLHYRRSRGQLSGGNHRAVASLEFLRVLDGFLVRDPGLPVRHAAQLRRTLHEFYVGAADAHADQDGRLALEMLARSLGHGRPTRETLSIAARALLPRSVIARARQLKAALTA